MPRWRWVVRVLTRQVWFRAAAFSLFSVVLALLAAWIAPVIPYEVSASIGAKAVDNILQILASSMLAVTTFSLTAMVSAFSAATQTVTPRVTQLLVEDSTTQNALSTFLGAFLFAIVGIIALSTGFYGESGRVVLYAGTILVIALIAVTLLRWIHHLMKFGRVDDGIARVEQATVKAVASWAEWPRRRDRPGTPADGMTALACEEIGYVTHVDLRALARLAEKKALRLHVRLMPGAFATPARPAVLIEGDADAATRERLADAFTIAAGRDYPQDPRFGLVVLSEIASRALSPAVNDPGTAIAVLGAGVRVFAAVAEVDRSRAPATDRVSLPAIAAEDLLEDLFRPITRDGAAMVEVGVRIQKALAAIRDLAPDLAEAAAWRAADALERAREAIASPRDVRTLEALHGDLFPQAGAEPNRTKSE